jgi:hypothetical protein
MNKSGVAENVIAPPKGGGALRGIGETFSADLHTGTGNMSVPIALPSARLTPELQLVYSTGNGNGLFGVMREGTWDWSRPLDKIIVDESGNIMSGHHRVLAADMAGVEIPETSIYITKTPNPRPVTSWPEILAKLKLK